MNRTRKIAVIAGAAVALIAGASTVALAAQPPVPTSRPTAHVASDRPIPPSIAVPAGQTLVAVFDVERGSQVYSCTKGAFTLLEPAAVLESGGRQVLHTRGPQWISANDGSAVTGSPVASVPVAGAVPELLLKATSNRGDGLFGNVDFIQRLDTKGGVAPIGECTEGSLQAVRYTAQYRFYAPSPAAATRP